MCHTQWNMNNNNNNNTSMNRDLFMDIYMSTYLECIYKWLHCLTYHIHWRNHQPAGSIAEQSSNVLAVKEKITI